MNHHETVVIGAGQAGLAMSRHLIDRDHVVLERGRLAERWRSERWDSLRMITPNWMTRLPGLRHPVADPEGFMTKDDLLALLEEYARSFGSPVREHTTVERVTRLDGGGFRVETDRGDYLSHNVVVATGMCGAPRVPGFAADLDSGIHQLHSSRYRNPAQLRSGPVLVVGAGASGMQIAAELRDAGREVILAIGRHARAVRRYRGRDIWWWMDRSGFLSTTADQVDDLAAARSAPSLGLVGRNEDIDLGSLERAGVRIAGRVQGGSGNEFSFAGDVHGEVADAEARLRRMLARFDTVAAELDEDVAAPAWPIPVRVERPLSGRFDLTGVRTIVWATGYAPSYPWLDVDVFDARGEIVHTRGVTEVPGLFVLGMRFLWRRDSHFVDGVGRDAEFLASRIADRRRMAVA